MPWRPANTTLTQHGLGRKFMTLVASVTLVNAMVLRRAARKKSAYDVFGIPK